MSTRRIASGNGAGARSTRRRARRRPQDAPPARRAAACRPTRSSPARCAREPHGRREEAAVEENGRSDARRSSSPPQMQPASAVVPLACGRGHRRPPPIAPAPRERGSARGAASPRDPFRRAAPARATHQDAGPAAGARPGAVIGRNPSSSRPRTSARVTSTALRPPDHRPAAAEDRSARRARASRPRAVAPSPPCTGGASRAAARATAAIRAAPRRVSRARDRDCRRRAAGARRWPPARRRAPPSSSDTRIRLKSVVPPPTSHTRTWSPSAR